MNFKSLKKANLHLHITGALNPSDLRRIAKISRFDTSAFEPLESHMNFFDPEVWTPAKELTSTSRGLLEGIKTILMREGEDRVVYVELTINPAGMLRRGMINKDVINAIIKGIEFGKSLGTKCKIKFGVNRKDGPDSVSIVKQVFKECPGEYTAGIDLNGDEKLFPTLVFVKPFQQLILEDIPVSVHAGEFVELGDSLRDAIRIHPSRIAHAVAAINNEDLLGAIKENNIIIESSPISNIKTGAIKCLKDHPVKKFLEYRIPVLLGSDDPAIFDTSLTTELESLKEVGFTEEQIVGINNYSLSKAH